MEIHPILLPRKVFHDNVDRLILRMKELDAIKVIDEVGNPVVYVVSPQLYDKIVEKIEEEHLKK